MHIYKFDPWLTHNARQAVLLVFFGNTGQWDAFLQQHTTNLVEMHSVSPHPPAAGCSAEQPNACAFPTCPELLQKFLESALRGGQGRKTTCSHALRTRDPTRARLPKARDADGAGAPMGSERPKVKMAGTAPTMRPEPPPTQAPTIAPKAPMVTAPEVPQTTAASAMGSSSSPCGQVCCRAPARCEGPLLSGPRPSLEATLNIRKDTGPIVNRRRQILGNT